MKDNLEHKLIDIREHLKNPYTRKKVYGKFSSGSWSIFRALLLAGLCFIILYPLIYMLSMGIRSWEQFGDPLVIWVPSSITFENFYFALQLMEYNKSFFLTFSIAMISSLLQLISCSLAGYGFARFTFKGKNIFFGCVLFTIIVPPQTYIIPLYLQYRFFDFFGLGILAGIFAGKTLTINLLNNVITFYLPAILGRGIRSGLFIYIFTQFFRGMPRELEDAAHIDGCGFIQTYLQVFIPNSSPALLTVFLFSFVWYWNDYFFSSMFFSSLNTVSTGLTSIQSEWLTLEFSTPEANPFRFAVTTQAACVLAMAPVLILYIVLQRYFTESIERTGIVG